MIPTKDEPYIERLVKHIHNTIFDYNHEIIVIEKNDISKKIEGAQVIQQKTSGLGNAILEGLDAAKGDVMIIMDGDGSHRPEDIRGLLKHIDGSDIVIGSRFVEGGRTLDKSFNKYASLFYRKFASIALGINIKDNMSGFSAVKRDVFRDIGLKPLGYKINLEIIYKASKKGYKIKEAPIVFLPRKEGKSKRNLKVALEVIMHIIALRLGIR